MQDPKTGVIYSLGYIKIKTDEYVGNDIRNAIFEFRNSFNKKETINNDCIKESKNNHNMIWLYL